MLRSPHAHARIARLDTSAAATAPGVVAVYTGADTAEALKPIPCAWLVPNSDLKIAEYLCMARDTVRYVGDIVAVVVAETPHQAADALELIEIEYDPLPDRGSASRRRRSGAPQLHAPKSRQQAFHWTVAGGDVDAAFASADVVVRDRIVQQRLIPTAMEPRGAVGSSSRRPAS
jgi:aerobic carbon-monoxide dehydrogenase large subunit